MIKVKKYRSVEERSGLEMRCFMDNETKRAESLFLAGEFAESLSLLKELAKDPANGRAQYLLGLFYFYAVEVRWNGDRFLELVDSGWRAGDVLSGFFILYRDGEGNKKEMTEKYVEHMKKLLPMAKAGDPFAMRQIAILYERGLGRKINMDQAYDWYVRSAEKGLCLSMADAGRIAMDESFSRYDPKLAFTWFLKGAALGYHEAELRLGDCFYGAIGVEEDKEKAATCFERASNHGNGEASDALGTMYVLGDGISQDMDKAYEFFTKGAEQGSPSCMYKLGDCYLYGRGTEINYEKAMDLYLAAWDKGNVPAGRSIGRMHLLGLAKNSEASEGFRWIEKAADTGDIDAIASLGDCYVNGEGTEVDEEKGRTLLEEAAEQGQAEAICELGELALRDQDGDGAVRRFKEAAAQGYPRAENFLGLCYATGIGGTRNLRAAEECFRRSDAQGDPDAKLLMQQYLNA